MKRRTFLSYCGFLAAAGLLAACGQSSDMVTTPVVESESIALNAPDAVSVAEAKADWPCLDATEDALALLATCTSMEDEAFSDGLTQLQIKYPGMNYLTFSSFFPFAGKPAQMTVSAPGATAMTAQQAANLAKPLLQAGVPDIQVSAVSALCVCPYANNPSRQCWLIRAAADPDLIEDGSLYFADPYHSVFLDAITGALVGYSLYPEALGGQAAADADKLTALADTAAKNLDELLSAVGMGLAAAQELTISDDGTAYIIDIGGEMRRIRVMESGEIYSIWDMAVFAQATADDATSMPSAALNSVKEGNGQ